METLRQTRKNGLRKKEKKRWKHQGIKTRENGHNDNKKQKGKKIMEKL